MKYYIIISSLILIHMGCSTSNKPTETPVHQIRTVENISNKPHVVQRTGTTPKFVVYEEHPIPIKKVRPEYPQSAREAGIVGQVLIRAEVFEDGSVGSVEIVEGLQPGPGGIDECAIEAVKHWEFIPAKLQKKPIAVWVTFPISFLN